MNGRGVQDDERPSIARRMQKLERYCDRHFNNEELTLEGLQERIAGVPPDAVLGSNFFHRACGNKEVTLEMIECLLGAFPAAVRWTDSDGDSPLHCACWSNNPDPRIVRVLLDSWPEAVNHRNNAGDLPLHCLCTDITGLVADDTISSATLDLLLAAAPLSATLANGNGFLPIHTALHKSKPRLFCKGLIDAYPEALRVQERGYLPIHFACYKDHAVETMKYLAELYPESLAIGDPGGNLPIHCVARGTSEYKKEVIRYLLARDPDKASKTEAGGFLPLHLVCFSSDVCLESVRLLFDAYPEAINIRCGGGGGRGKTPLDLARAKLGQAMVEFMARKRGKDTPVQFLGEQLTYARQAEDSRAMHTPDVNGWLPLHHALRNGASLGAIKLLLKANPAALHVYDDQSAFPLHIASEFSTVGVVHCLLGLSDIHLQSVDAQSDSTLHHACCSGNVGVVNYLLERDAPLVSEPNDGGKLPIHVLWESGRVDRNNVEYVEAVWRLLLAHPETVRR